MKIQNEPANRDGAGKAKRDRTTRRFEIYLFFDFPDNFRRDIQLSQITRKISTRNLIFTREKRKTKTPFT